MIITLNTSTFAGDPCATGEGFEGESRPCAHSSQSRFQEPPTFNNNFCCYLNIS